LWPWGSWVQVPSSTPLFHSGASPSGKARDFGSRTRRFESFRPSHLLLISEYIKCAISSIGRAADAAVPPAAPSGSSQTESPAKSPTAKRTPSHITSYMMYQEGDTFAEIAQKRSLTLTTVQNHIIRSGMEGYELDWDALIPQEYEDLILERIKTLGTNKLRPIKDGLPDQVSYLAIRAVIGKYGEELKKA
jgi:hypothetical protein